MRWEDDAEAQGRAEIRRHEARMEKRKVPKNLDAKDPEQNKNLGDFE